MSESIDVSALCLISLHVMYFTRFQCLGYVHFVGVFSSDVNKTFFYQDQGKTLFQDQDQIFSRIFVSKSQITHSVST